MHIVIIILNTVIFENKIVVTIYKVTVKINLNKTKWSD